MKEEETSHAFHRWFSHQIGSIEFLTFYILRDGLYNRLAMYNGVGIQQARRHGVERALHIDHRYKIRPYIRVACDGHWTCGGTSHRFVGSFVKTSNFQGRNEEFLREISLQ